jgi:hypothetical protein
MDMSLIEMCRAGKIDETVAMEYATEPDTMRRLLGI